MSEAIKVVVRVRPMNRKETDRGCTSILHVDEQNNQISLKKPDEPDNVKAFAFDNLFGENSRQQAVYTKTAYNLVENVLTGYNGTIFAYGQTGCGKTHSMVGVVEDEEMQGIIPRSFGHILKSISQTKSKQFLIRCSFIEIYNEEVRDLLSNDVKNKLDIKESPDKGVFIKDLSINQAKTHEELMGYMNLGNKNRSVGQTAMNKDSSRSHLLFALYLESAEDTAGEDKKYVASKLNLVDLAGSERISKTGVSGDRLKEAQKINLSLSALGNVISALVDGKSHHIPYRDSKLTRLLQDSLGGNTKTVMIANCSPADYNFDETLSTLRYASRAKFIKNKPIINQDPKDALLKQYAEEIKKLKTMLANQGEGGGGVEIPHQVEIAPNHDEHHERVNEKIREKQEELNNQKQEKKKLLQKIKELEGKHLEAKDVHMKTQYVKNLEQVKHDAEEEEKRRISHFGVKQKSIEEEMKIIEMQNQNDVQKDDKYRNIVKKLKSKVKNLEQELKDITHQNFVDKEENLEDVRVLSKENKMYEAIINTIVNPSDLETIKTQCQFNSDQGEYRIPPFYFKGKQLFFPKLQENQSMDMIRQMQEQRILTFEEDNKQNKKDDSKFASGVSPSHKNNNSGEYCVKDIIKQARQGKDFRIQKSVSPYKEEKVPRKVQLSPIRKGQTKLS